MAGSGLVLLHLGLVWLVLFRVTSLSLLPGYVLDFYIVDMIVQTVGVQVWVVCQVDIRHNGTMSGDVGIYFIDCVRMEVFSLKQSGKDDFEFGKVCLAFSTTALRESDTRSCWLLRSLVPVWMMMWLGWPS